MVTKGAKVGRGATRAGATTNPFAPGIWQKTKHGQPGETPPLKRDVVETMVTDGGLTVVTEHMPDVLSVSLGFWVGTGSVDEPEPIAGASHFLEHLLFKGTAQRSARQIAEAIDAVGGDMNAFTTKEHTAFYVRLLADSIDLGLDILSETLARRCGWTSSRPNVKSSSRKYSCTGTSRQRRSTTFSMPRSTRNTRSDVTSSASRDRADHEP